jgi:hypothetical protein
MLIEVLASLVLGTIWFLLAAEYYSHRTKIKVRRTLLDRGYMDEVLEYTQDALIIRLAGAFPMLRVFGQKDGPEEFVEAVRLAVLDSVTTGINQVIQANNDTGGAYVAPQVPGDPSIMGPQIMQALVQSLLPGGRK